LKDSSADKRAKLVDRLLASEEYARNWAGIWTNWLLPRTGTSATQRRASYAWLTKQFAAKKSHKELVETLLTASGKNDEQPAINFILAHLGKEFPADKRADEGQYDAVPLASRSLRLFLGYRLVAYQLPDHPVHPDFKPE